MNHHLLSITTLILLVGLGIYQVQSHKEELLGGGFAAIATLTGTTTDCQSPYLLQPLLNSEQAIQTRIDSLPASSTIPTEIASTTNALKAIEVLLKKATTLETTTLKSYNTNTPIYQKQLASYRTTLDKTLTKLNTTTNVKTRTTLLKTASSTEASIRKVEASLSKSLSTYTAAKNNRQGYTDTKTTLTTYLYDLQHGTTKASLEALKTIAHQAVVDMQKRRRCPTEEGHLGNVTLSNKSCTDGIDNDMNGKADCEDTSCRGAATACGYVYIGGGTTGGTTGGGTTAGAGTCTDPKYTTKSACEAATIENPGFCPSYPDIHDEGSCTNAGSNWNPPTSSPAGLSWAPTSTASDEGSGGSGPVDYIRLSPCEEASGFGQYPNDYDGWKLYEEAVKRIKVNCDSDLCKNDAICLTIIHTPTPKTCDELHAQFKKDEAELANRQDKLKNLGETRYIFEYTGTLDAYNTALAAAQKDVENALANRNMTAGEISRNRCYNY
jgi:hypothetical protein